MIYMIYMYIYTYICIYIYISKNHYQWCSLDTQEL